MTRKRIIIVSSVIACIALISVSLAMYFDGDEGLEFAGKNPEEIKAYFKSEEFQKLNRTEKIEMKKKAYASFYHKIEQEFVDRAKTYSQLPPEKKVAYLDEMIDQMVRDAEKKRRDAIAKRAIGNKTESVNGDKSKGVNSNQAKPGDAKKKFSAQNYRGWSEKTDPQKRAYIMELKEAMMQRMEQRGIKIRK